MDKTWSKIFDDGNDGSVQGIKRQIDRENKFKRGVLQSIIQWRRIIEEIDGTYTGSSKTENESRLRYFYQHQYNQLLSSEMDNLRSQLKTTSKDNLESIVNKTSFQTLSLPELRTRVRELKRENGSLKSQLSMNERQLDRESMAFHKIRQSCDAILNDVIFQHQTRLEQQKKFDKQFFTKIRQNLHSTLFGRNHKSRTSCLGLAASRSAHLSRQILSEKRSDDIQAAVFKSRKTSTNQHLPSATRDQYKPPKSLANRHPAIKCGIKNRRHTTINNSKSTLSNLNDGHTPVSKGNKHKSTKVRQVQAVVSKTNNHQSPELLQSNSNTSDKFRKHDETVGRRMKRALNILTAIAAFKNTSKSREQHSLSEGMNTNLENTQEQTPKLTALPSSQIVEEKISFHKLNTIRTTRDSPTIASNANRMQATRKQIPSNLPSAKKNEENTLKMNKLLGIGKHNNHTKKGN